MPTVFGTLSQTRGEMRSELTTSYGELEQRTRELSCLLSVSEILTPLTDTSNLKAVLGSVLDKALELIGTKVGGILLMDEERQMLHYRVHRGLSRQYVDRMWLRPDEGIVGRVSKTGRSLVVEDALVDPFAAHLDLIAEEGLRSFVSVPLPARDRVLGVLNVISHQVRRFSSEDVRLLESIAGQIGTAIEKARLYEEVLRKEEVRGELLEDMFAIQEEERRRIARGLHDETSQVLASLGASLEAAARTLPPEMAQSHSLLRKAQEISVSILDEIHRIIYELRPTLLDDLGLVAATRWLLDNKLGSGVKANFEVAGRERRLPSKLEVTLFRVIQEAVSNIVRHAGARSVVLRLTFKKNSIRVQIRDDGVGFDVGEAIASKDRPRGLGLLGMKERVELMNGLIGIRSRSGGGTKIDIQVPLSEEVHSGAG